MIHYCEYWKPILRTCKILKLEYYNFLYHIHHKYFDNWKTSTCHKFRQLKKIIVTLFYFDWGKSQSLQPWRNQSRAFIRHSDASEKRRDITPKVGELSSLSDNVRRWKQGTSRSPVQRAPPRDETAAAPPLLFLFSLFRLSARPSRVWTRSVRRIPHSAANIGSHVHARVRDAHPGIDPRALRVVDERTIVASYSPKYRCRGADNSGNATCVLYIVSARLHRALPSTFLR